MSSPCVEKIFRPHRGLIACLALAGLALSGCASRGGSVPYNPANFGPPDVEVQNLPLSQQRLAPADKLSVTVFQVEDLSGEFIVDPQGNVELPLIGRIAAQGKTAQELDQEITERLAGRYLRNPDVQVAVLERAEQTITVEGSVEEPGVLPIRGSTTLLRAVALAKGTSDDANPARVIVFRTIDGEQMHAAFDLRAIRRAEAEDPAIYGNDIIVVDGSRSRSLFRDIVSALPVLGIFVPFTR